MKAPSSSRDSKRKQVSSCSSTCALALYTGSEKCSGLRADSYLYSSSSFCKGAWTARLETGSEAGG